MIVSTQEHIDLIWLYCNCDAQKWNAYLTESLNRGDVQGLIDTLRRIQKGMDKAYKDKLATDKVVELFIRLQRSIEITLKKIYRQRHHNPLYDPLAKVDKSKFIDDKRQKDNNFEKFLKQVRY